MTVVLRYRTTERAGRYVAHGHVRDFFDKLERMRLAARAVTYLALAVIATSVNQSRHAEAQGVILSTSDLFCAVLKARNLSWCDDSWRHRIDAVETQLAVLVASANKQSAIDIDKCCVTIASIYPSDLAWDNNFLGRELVLEFSKASSTDCALAPRIYFTLVQNHESLVAPTRNHIDPLLGQLLHQNRRCFNFRGLFNPELALFIRAHGVDKIVF